MAEEQNVPEEKKRPLDMNIVKTGESESGELTFKRNPAF